METHFMQSAYALRICIADTDRGSVRMEMYMPCKQLIYCMGGNRSRMDDGGDEQSPRDSLSDGDSTDLATILQYLIRRYM